MLIYEFYEAYSNIASIYLKVRDESMIAIRFHITSRGNLPNLSYIFHKPEPLGTDLKKVVCSVIEALIF